jgi:hypothetical protein
VAAASSGGVAGNFDVTNSNNKGNIFPYSDLYHKK